MRTPRAVLITGAGSGIGRAIATAFADRGDVVHLADISRDRLEATREILADHPVHIHQADVSNWLEAERLVNSAARQGGIDVLVNAAGVFDGYAGIEDTTPQLWSRVIGINLTGAFHMCKAAVARMAPQGREGRIISIGSIGAFRGGADGLSYCASKAGLVGLHRRLAVDVAPFGITANVICPGAVATSIRDTSAEILGDDVPQQRGIGVNPELSDWLVPARRVGQPSEVAALAVFLASAEAGFITGQSLNIDGGYTAK